MKLQSARKAIHDATSLDVHGVSGDWQKYGCHIQKSSIGSVDRMIVDRIEAGYILKAVYDQLPHVRDWLLYAYSFDADKNHKAFLAAHLFQRLFQSERFSGHARLRRLADVAVDDFKARQVNHRSLPIAYICNRISEGESRKIFESNYKRDGWDKLMLKTQDLLDTFDRIGLSAVAVVINKLNGCQK